MPAPPALTALAAHPSLSSLCSALTRFAIISSLARRHTPALRAAIEQTMRRRPGVDQAFWCGLVPRPFDVGTQLERNRHFPRLSLAIKPPVAIPAARLIAPADDDNLAARSFGRLCYLVPGLQPTRLAVRVAVGVWIVAVRCWWAIILGLHLFRLRSTLGRDKRG